MSDPYSARGQLTVQRVLHPHTSLVMVWVLKSLVWDEQSDEYDLVKVYAAHANEVEPTGVPRSDRSVQAICSFNEIPEDVQDEFIDQAGRLAETVLERLQEDEE